MRFAVGLELSRAYGLEPRSQIKCIEAPVDKFEWCRARNGNWSALTRQRQYVFDPGEQHTFGFHQVTNSLQELLDYRSFGRTAPRIELEPVTHYFVDKKTLSLTSILLSNGDSEVDKNFELRLVPQDLTINEKAVHVKESCS